MSTIIQNLRTIEKIIYVLPYDNLSPYLQGVRDIVNLVNGTEDGANIAETVQHNLFEQAKKIYGGRKDV